MNYDQYEKITNLIYFYHGVIVLIALTLTLIKIMLQIHYFRGFTKGKAIPNIVIFTYNYGIKNQALTNLNIRYLLLEVLKSIVPVVSVYQIFTNILFLLKLALYYINRKHFVAINKTYLRFGYQVNQFLNKRIF